MLLSKPADGKSRSSDALDFNKALFDAQSLQKSEANDLIKAGSAKCANSLVDASRVCWIFYGATHGSAVICTF
jgi:hypothetical protein